VEGLGHYLRLILSMRFFLRVFSFAYPLSLLFMYNYLVFGYVSMKIWVGYVAFMGFLELFLAVFVDRPFSRRAFWWYIFLAVFLEFPYALVVSLTRSYPETVPFIPWVLFWYGSLLLLSYFLIRLTNGRKDYLSLK